MPSVFAYFGIMRQKFGVIMKELAEAASILEAFSDEARLHRIRDVRLALLETSVTLPVVLGSIRYVV